jgi:hypothetical protein
VRELNYGKDKIINNPKREREREREKESLEEREEGDGEL